MHAIIPNRPARSRPYAWGSISVDPDPPRVGGVTTITFPLANPGPDEIVVERIDARIAFFGMGMQWEPLPVVGPFRLSPDPHHVELAHIEWTPQQGGHRCVRAAIHVRGEEQPFQVARNLQVIEAAAGEERWHVPFHLGNPAREPAPIMLVVGGNAAAALDATVRVGKRIVPLEQPIWLRPGEEVLAELLLHARTDAALHHIRTVEAFIGGRLLDGIQVTVNRPARAAEEPLSRPRSPEVARRSERELAYAVAG
jgi:hypothetical protein